MLVANVKVESNAKSWCSLWDRRPGVKLHAETVVSNFLCNQAFVHKRRPISCQVSTGRENELTMPIYIGVDLDNR